MSSPNTFPKPWERLQAAIARQHQTEPGTWLRPVWWLRNVPEDPQAKPEPEPNHEVDTLRHETEAA